MNKLYLLILFVVPNYIYSQQSAKQESDSVKITSHEIHMQEGIKKLLQKNQQIHYKKGGVGGFCIHIYSGNSREECEKIKSQVMKRFPEITSVHYERVSPNWKVRVGKCRTKLEAKKLQSIIRKVYPGSYITEINVPIGEFD
tara:strand:+ start:26 stop:451 length:426 start_codon:yes stop_codon:yes gene_type:complete